MATAGMLLAGMLAVSIGTIGASCRYESANLQCLRRNTKRQRCARCRFFIPGTLVIVQGDAESLVIDADASVAHAISTRISGSRLVIENTSSLASSGSITVRLTVKSLSSLEQTGEGHIEMDGLETSQLRLITRGAANARLDRITVDGLRVATYGVGTIDVSGTATQQEVEMYGAGAYRASRSGSSDTSVELHGAGTVSVQASSNA